jgi:hypothetical protein
LKFYRIRMTFGRPLLVQSCFKCGSVRRIGMAFSGGKAF